MTACLAFPYRIDPAGRTATADLNAYVETLVLLVLDTAPGERVNRPTFGAELKALVFEGMNSTLAAAAETMVRGKLMQVLAGVIAIRSLRVTLHENTLRIALSYDVLANATRVDQQIVHALPGAAPTGAGPAVARVGTA